MSVHTGIYESHAKVIHFNAPLAQSSSFTGVFTRAVVAAAVATAKTTATAMAGPLAGAATAAVVMGTSTLQPQQHLWLIYLYKKPQLTAAN